MEIPYKTLKSGLSMPVVGKGTWMTNIGKKPHPSLNDQKRIDEIKDAIAGGISYIDTAERYENGYGETLIGKAIKGHNREKLFLASKVSSNHLSYESVILSAKASIKRLQSSYIDLYQIHQFNPDAPLQETMRAMDYLIEKKLIKNIGVYNFTIKQLQDAQSYTKNKIVSNQLQYSLMQRDPEQKKIIEYCQKQDMMIISWNSFQQENISPKTKILIEKTAQKHAKTPSQIATIWLLSQPNTVVLFKLNSVNKIKELVETSREKMAAEEIDLLS